MEVNAFESLFLDILAQVFGEAFCQRSDQYQFFFMCPFLNLFQEILYLSFSRFHVDYLIDKACRTNYLLDHPALAFFLIHRSLVLPKRT